MKNKIRTSHIALLTALAAMLLPRTSSACAVCMGASGTSVTPAINAAIFLLMGFIGAMLAGVCGFAFYLFKRASKPLPPHAEITGMV